MRYRGGGSGADPSPVCTKDEWRIIHTQTKRIKTGTVSLYVSGMFHLNQPTVECVRVSGSGLCSSPVVWMQDKWVVLALEQNAINVLLLETIQK